MINSDKYKFQAKLFKTNFSKICALCNNICINIEKRRVSLNHINSKTVDRIQLILN